jgi:halocyanin-like protein
LRKIEPRASNARRRYPVAADAVAAAGCLGLGSDDDAEGTDDADDSPDETDDTPTPEATPTTEPTGTMTDDGDDGPYGGWFADTDNFDGTADVLGFSPPAIRVSQGSTVTWEWTGNGGQHDVRVEDQPDDAAWNGQTTLRSETGFTYEHAFETPGTYLYYCDPHLPQGVSPC